MEATKLVTKIQTFKIACNPIGKKTLIFTFDGKIEYIILPMLILYLICGKTRMGGCQVCNCF